LFIRAIQGNVINIESGMTADCPFAMKEPHLPTCSHSKPS